MSAACQKCRRDHGQSECPREMSTSDLIIELSRLADVQYGYLNSTRADEVSTEIDRRIPTPKKCLVCDGSGKIVRRRNDREEPCSLCKGTGIR